MNRLSRAAATVKARWLDWASFLVPLAVSLAANTVWGLQSGSAVFLVAGLVTPLTLVLAVERWQKTPAYTDWRRAVQIVGMGVVALVAAAWSWTHTTQLLLDQAPPGDPSSWSHQLMVALCVTAPLAIDGLAVLSVLSLGHSPAPVPEVAKVVERAAAEPAAAAVEADEAWGGPDTVDGHTEPATLRALPVRPARRATRPQRATAPSVAGGRTKRQLEARAKELGLTRPDANETKASLAARVEAREATLSAETPTTSARPIPARTEGVPA